MDKAIILWLTGLSGSGKTTIAYETADFLRAKGKSVKVFDGDEIRKLQPDLTFSPEDIKKNNIIVTKLCKEFSQDFDYIFVSVITPYQVSRLKSREELGDQYNEVFVKASLDTVIQRDSKGLYKKALNNEIPNFIGISKKTPFETPINPDIILDTEFYTFEQCVKKLIGYVQNKFKI